MKTILLIIILITGLRIQVFSQVNARIDTTCKLSVYNFKSIDNAIRSKTLDSINNKLRMSNLQAQRIPFNNKKTIIVSPYDNMPSINPQGSFAMRVYKPDSAVNYSLRIKKIPANPAMIH